MGNKMFGVICDHINMNLILKPIVTCNFEIEKCP